ncbi:MAG: tetratricopeptide repeat protein [Phycisphaerae bacterium]|nr:tetratricopeptide repeat protein [Phycisphaerae bacterium]
MADGPSSTLGVGGSLSRHRRLLWPLPIGALALVAIGAGVWRIASSIPADDPREPLAAAAAQLGERKFDEAIETLNTRAMPMVASGKAGREITQEFFRLRARAVAQGQAELGVERVENARVIAGDLRAAEKAGAALDAGERFSLAGALVSMGEIEPALERIRALPPEMRGAGRELIRRVVTRNIESEDVKYDLTLGLLNEIADDPSGTADERAWAVAKQGELRLTMGYTEEAVTKLLRAMPRLDGASRERRAELLALLGRAYLTAGQRRSAEEHLLRAVEDLPGSSPARAEAMVLLGRAMQSDGRAEEARERYSAAEQSPDTGGVRGPALLGLAELDAAADADDTALERYAEVVAELPRLKHRRDISAGQVTESLMLRHAERFARGRYESALRYALLAESARGASEQSTEVLRALATTNFRLALAGLEDAVGAGASARSMDRVSPVTRAEVKRYFLAAADAFRQHARLVVINDIGAYKDSLWSAADSFDRGGDNEEAVRAFTEYLAGAGDEDPRRAESQFRLGQLYEARGEFATAASFYEKLASSRDRAAPAGGAGVWSDASVVPLARCLRSDGDASNDAEAERLLAAVLEGGRVGPESPEYQAALIELGEMLYDEGRHSEAVTRLREAVERYPDDAGRVRLCFKLADSCRLSARQIEQDLAEARPQAERDELIKARLARLREARPLYASVVSQLRARSADFLGAAERLYLRNAMFYIGDCAFDLREFDAAIREYDAARQAYPEDPSSLVAMVQIVAAYLEQGEPAKAATANERARQHFASLPESAWSGPNLPMERRHWEQWLKSRAALDGRADAGGEGARPE